MWLGAELQTRPKPHAAASFVDISLGRTRTAQVLLKKQTVLNMFIMFWHFGVLHLSCHPLQTYASHQKTHLSSGSAAM
jgi:hypothetical protein